MIKLVNYYFSYLKGLGYNVSRMIPLQDNSRDGTTYLVVQAKPLDIEGDMCRSSITRTEMSIILISETIRSYDKAHNKLKEVEGLLKSVDYPVSYENARIYSASKYIYEELGLDDKQRYAIKLKFEVFHDE